MILKSLLVFEPSFISVATFSTPLKLSHRPANSAIYYRLPSENCCYISIFSGEGFSMKNCPPRSMFSPPKKPSLCWWVEQNGWVIDGKCGYFPRFFKKTLAPPLLRRRSKGELRWLSDDSLMVMLCLSPLNKLSFYGCLPSFEHNMPTSHRFEWCVITIKAAKSY